jgi:tetratricopeptide (TPR) repeat protein
MREDTNPGRTENQSAGDRDHLAEALESLVATAPFRSDAGSGNPTSFKAPEAGPCPELGEWFRLATGSTSQVEKEALLSHASLCTACLARLRGCQHVLSPDVSSDESEQLGKFASSTPQWQHRLAVELARTPHRGKQKRMPRILIWASAVTAALLVGAASAAIWWQQQNSPENLLAQAYTNARTFDLRIPGAGFAPVGGSTHLRGGSTGRESAPLLNARAKIENKLENNPSDARWLQLQARAEILEENYDAAIDILDRLIAAGPVTAGLLTDDGSAYYLRGVATGSENDRATALDYLSRADELAPSDPVVLFNEALVMEDRGQVMNAVETWNRYIKFERDPKWLEEGRQRLRSLEDKLNRMKTHESRMEQHIATPQAMRALSADTTTLASIDEELSTTFLPRLLDAAFPLPVDRSRGSPCDEMCLAARSLLHSLASSLEAHHQDSWLAQFLPPDSSLTDLRFQQAADALGGAIDANTRGSYVAAEGLALESSDLFRKLHNEAGEDRAEVERIFALQRTSMFAACLEAIDALLPKVASFGWIEGQAVGQLPSCNMNRGTAATNNPIYLRPMQLAQAHHYALLELRARNMLAGSADESSDSETTWRVCLETIRKFYTGDYPPYRVATTISGLAAIEDNTPRARLDLLLNREALGLALLSPNHQLQVWARDGLIRAAIRAGELSEAREQLTLVRNSAASGLLEKSELAGHAESEIFMANLYLDRGDLHDAALMLDAAYVHMAGQESDFHKDLYALARGQLELASGHPETAESTLRKAILNRELQAGNAGRENIIFARQDRDLYAALAGVWLAQSQPGVDILALWERYRLRILGKPVPACPKERLDCLAPQIRLALRSKLPGAAGLLVGQVALLDRTLLYRADARGVAWRTVPLRQKELLAVAASLERVASTPSSSQISVDEAARRLGGILFDGLPSASKSDSLLILEPDPLLGNVPWPAVATAEGPIGLRFNIEEAPTLLQASHSAPSEIGRPLIVGASAAAGEHQFLPEVLNEARAVAGVESNADTLLAAQATQAQVAARLSSATLIHFAGHAAKSGDSTRLLLASDGKAGDRPFVDSSLLLKDPPRSARLVVFSACSTGKREEGWNHGMGDIVDTLASLGVPEVVATRWQIDSASAVPIMSAFYRGLAGGLSVPKALTAARLSLIRDARYSHPYYWAGYYASGVGNTDLREVIHGDRK